MGVSEKIRIKTLSQDVFDRKLSFGVVKTLIKISVGDL